MLKASSTVLAESNKRHCSAERLTRSVPTASRSRTGVTPRFTEPSDRRRPRKGGIIVLPQRHLVAPGSAYHDQGRLRPALPRPVHDRVRWRRHVEVDTVLLEQLGNPVAGDIVEGPVAAHDDVMLGRLASAAAGHLKPLEVSAVRGKMAGGQPLIVRSPSCSSAPGKSVSEFRDVKCTGP